MMKVFQGPNGWYLADEGEDGFHHQPLNGGNLTQEDALLLLRDLKEEQAYEHWREYGRRTMESD